LRRADPPSKESYQISKYIHKFQKLNSESEQAMMAYLDDDDDEEEEEEEE
jgi:hypothetical protein